MKLTFSFILLISAHLAMGQWHIGGRAGVMFSDFNSPTDLKTTLNQGMMVGITATSKISYDLDFQLGVEYAEKGYHHLVCNTIYEKLETTFIQAPLLVSYNIPLAEKLKLKVKAGGYVAYWLSGNYKTEGYDLASNEYDFELMNAKRIDFGAAGGAQIEYLLLNGNLFGVDFRYDFGIADMEGKPDSGKNTNRSWVMGINYKFLLK